MGVISGALSPLTELCLRRHTVTTAILIAREGSYNLTTPENGAFNPTCNLVNWTHLGYQYELWLYPPLRVVSKLHEPPSDSNLTTYES